MSFYLQFQLFDPASGDVPRYPFRLLPSIAARARALLKSRTAEQIDAVAQEIDWAFEEYFRTVKEDEIARLRNELTSPLKWKRTAPEEEAAYYRATEFFDWDGGSDDNGRWLFKDGMEDQLDIPTAYNTSEVDTLKECIDWWADIGVKGFPDGAPHEFFAVLSLWMLADAIQSFNNRASKTIANELAEHFDTLLVSLGDKHGVRMDGVVIPEGLSHGVSDAGESALKAMEAVCYAEHLQERARLEAAHALALDKIPGQQEAMRNSWEDERQKQERDERTARAKQLNIARHAKRNEAMAKVIDEWTKDTSKFPSAEKAGGYFADWLITQGIVKTIEPRTVAGWIRTHAKQIGVRLR